MSNKFKGLAAIFTVGACFSFFLTGCGEKSASSDVIGLIESIKSESDQSNFEELVSEFKSKADLEINEDASLCDELPEASVGEEDSANLDCVRGKVAFIRLNNINRIWPSMVRGEGDQKYAEVTTENIGRLELSNVRIDNRMALEIRDQYYDINIAGDVIEVAGTNLSDSANNLQDHKKFEIIGYFVDSENWQSSGPDFIGIVTAVLDKSDQDYAREQGAEALLEEQRSLALMEKIRSSIYPFGTPKEDVAACEDQYGLFYGYNQQLQNNAQWCHSSNKEHLNFLYDFGSDSRQAYRGGALQAIFVHHINSSNEIEEAYHMVFEEKFGIGTKITSKSGKVAHVYGCKADYSDADVYPPSKTVSNFWEIGDQFFRDGLNDNAYYLFDFKLDEGENSGPRPCVFTVENYRGFNAAILTVDF